MHEVGLCPVTTTLPDLKIWIVIETQEVRIRIRILTGIHHFFLESESGFRFFRFESESKSESSSKNLESGFEAPKNLNPDSNPNLVSDSHITGTNQLCTLNDSG